MIFSDKILTSYFPPAAVAFQSNTGSAKPAPSGGLVYTNIAVLNYSSIKLLETWIKDISAQRQASADATDCDRQICYAMFQILNGVLSLHDGSSFFTVRTLRLKDILVCSCSTGQKGDSPEEYLVINPLHTCQDKPIEYEELLCQDTFNVLLALLNFSDDTGTKSSEIAALEAACSGRNSLTLSMLKQCGKTLAAATSISQLMVARSMLQFILWGPQEEEIRSLLLAKDREHAFCVWLEVMRCRCINELALGQVKPSLEVAHRFHFLCSITGATVFQLSKMLHIRQK